MNTQMLLNFISTGHTVVTGTERLARELRIRYSMVKRSEGASGWRTPEIVSLRRFVEALWLESWPAEQLVDAAQEAMQYERTIQSLETGASALLSPTQTARLAQQAATLTRQYRLSLTDERIAEEMEGRAFARWFRHVEKHKADNNWLTHDDLYPRVTRLLRHGKAHGPERVVVAGMLELTPLQATFVDALRLAGSEVAVLDPEREKTEDGPTTAFTRVRHETPEQEMSAAVDQLHEWLSTIDDPANPPAIAVIVPDVDEWRPRLERVFLERLAPQASWPTGGINPVPWRFTKGTPLLAHEVVHAAVQVLRLGRQTVDVDNLSHLLLNRRIGTFGAEQFGRAKLDYTVRSWGARRVGIKGVIECAEADPGRGIAPDIGARLRALIELRSEQKGSALPSEWVLRFESQLKTMGWPGAERLDTVAYQALEAWRANTAKFAGMDQILGALDHSDALELFSSLLEAHPFLPRMPYAAPIQVMGIQDIASHHYDYALALGVSATVLPPRPRPNPLLPYAMQKEAQIPGCCAETELKRGRTLAGYLQEIAPTVIVSCPEVTEQGHQLTPSQLLRPWPEAETNNLAEAGEEAAVSLKVQPDAFPPVSAEERERLTGGVSILSAYARNPFFAAAQARLKLREFPQPVDGLNARLQGEIVHAALDRIWGELKDSAALKGQSEEQRERLVTDVLDAVFEDATVVPRYAVPARLAAMEKGRAARVILRWLAYETERVEPFRVVAREEDVVGEIGGLRMNLRLDRVDEVQTDEGPRYLVWDYKSGSEVSTEGWNPDTLTEPQLPIYAVNADLTALGIERVDGIGFAHLTDSKCEAHIRTNWTGALAPRGGNQRPVSDWAGLVAEWRQQLAANAEGFLSGHGEVDYASLIRHRVTHGHLFGLVREADNT